MAIKVVMDVDTGTDDAVAIMLAALHPELELLSCTTVHGNVDVGIATQNTLAVLDNIGCSNIPVYQGCASAMAGLQKTLEMSARIHGTELPLPPTSRAKESISAPEYLVNTFRRSRGDVLLVAVGPLTNLASALLLDPSLSLRIPHLLIMGGGHAVSNVTAAAELNFWRDPEAAALVFSAGFPKITLVPLDASHQATISAEDCRSLEALGTNAGRAAASLIGKRISAHDEMRWMPVHGTAPVHDALCVGHLVSSILLETRSARVEVEAAGRLARGRSIIDFDGRSGEPPNCNVAIRASADALMNLMTDTFRRRV